MRTRNEKYRQIIFLILIISGTLILYSSHLFQTKKNDVNESILYNNGNAEINKINRDAEKLFSIFLKSPANKDGIDALFNSIGFWDQAGNDTLIQSAIIVFEKYIKDDSLKNKFYSRLGKYFVDMNRKSQTSTMGEIISKYSNPFKDQM